MPLKPHICPKEDCTGKLYYEAGYNETFWEPGQPESFHCLDCGDHWCRGDSKLVDEFFEQVDYERAE